MIADRVDLRVVLGLAIGIADFDLEQEAECLEAAGFRLKVS